MNLEEKDIWFANDFVGIVNRDNYVDYPVRELNVWIVKGKAKVGDGCRIATDHGVVEVQIVAIRIGDRAVLEAEAQTDVLITFSGFPPETVISWKSIVSTYGIAREEYAAMPFMMKVEGTWLPTQDYKEFVVVGRVVRGTIRSDDRILILHKDFFYSAYVENIEMFGQFHDQVSYWDSCGLFLYDVPLEIAEKITEGCIVIKHPE